MSESAFGVEHGDISKAGIPSSAVDGLRRLGGAASAGTNALAGKFKPKTPMTAGVGSFKRMQSGFAGGLKQAGNAMQRNPGKTGGAIAGGGVAAGGMAMNRNKR